MSQKNVILIHGKRSNPSSYWYPWLKTELQNKDIACYIPLLPHADDPIIDEWKAELDNEQPNEQTILIGHSRGGVAVLRWLEQQPEHLKISKVILISTGSGFPPETYKSENSKGFYTPKGYDFDAIKQHCDDFVVIHSQDDPVVPFAAGEENAKGLNARFIQFKNRGHFDANSNTTEFPELLNVILN